MIGYINNITISYVQQWRQGLKLPPEQAASSLSDVFKGQETEDAALLEDIIVVSIPANCTDCLQLMDLSINKGAKEFMRNRFRE